MTVQSLKCKSLRYLIKQHLFVDDDVKLNTLVECIHEKTKACATPDAFFRCLDTRKAWALTLLDIPSIQKIYKLFKIPHRPQNRDSIRNIIRVIRQSTIINITDNVKKSFLYNLPLPALVLLFRSIHQ